MKGVRSFGKSFSATTKILLPVILSTVALSGHSQAADHLFQPKDEGNLRLSAGIGYAWIRADERVYAEGDRISHLIWKSQTPVISGEIDFRSDTGLTVAARARVGVAGTGKMDDYDWIDDYFKSYRFEDWTHHSHHSVELERYFTGDIAIGYDFVLNDDNTLNLSGGLKYTNIKFNSYGGHLHLQQRRFQGRQRHLSRCAEHLLRTEDPGCLRRPAVERNVHEYPAHGRGSRRRDIPCAGHRLALAAPPSLSDPA